jgi:hypothetical protein
MWRKMHVAGYELVDRVTTSLRARGFPDEVRVNLCLRVFEYLCHVAQSYVSLPVSARDVYVTYARQDVAVSRLVLSRSLGKSPRLARRGGVVPEEPSHDSPPDLTAGEKNSTVRALFQAEDALCSSMAGLGQREAEALAEVLDELLGVFDLVGTVVCN